MNLTDTDKNSFNNYFTHFCTSGIDFNAPGAISIWCATSVANKHCKEMFRVLNTFQFLSYYKEDLCLGRALHSIDNCVSILWYILTKDNSHVSELSTFQIDIIDAILAKYDRIKNLEDEFLTK